MGNHSFFVEEWGLIETYVTKIQAIARSAPTESKFEVEVTPLLRELLAEYQVKYNPSINETLRSVGRSQVSAQRPDSLFGNVVLDYKVPGRLGRAREIKQSKAQIEGYLEEISSSPISTQTERGRLAGILFDGEWLTFCHDAGGEWRWTPLYPVSAASLMTLVQTYRSLDKEPLNSTLLCRYFGKDSEVAQQTVSALISALSDPSPRTYMLFKEWMRLFEQAASYDYAQVPSLKTIASRLHVVPASPAHVLFALHTYYSIVVKLLTAELLNCTRDIEPNLIVSNIANATSYHEVFRIFTQLENGDFYKRYRINNFLEGDFFSWYISEVSSTLSDALVKIADEFSRFEPATPKLKPETMKDLLKEFYSGIMDEQLRHDIGEYYTPDWLAQYVLERTGYFGQIGKVCLDPACGSGTFLVTCIGLLRAQCERSGLNPLETLQTILRSIRGLDLNPLAVISARANYILAIADLIFQIGEDVDIPVYLADAINLPIEHNGVYEYPLETEVGTLRLEMPAILVRHQVVDKILERCEADIENGLPPDRFLTGLHYMPKVMDLLTPEIEQSLSKFYANILSLNMRKPPWDSIWCRVFKNTISTRTFDRVDFIVGNPPWVRWSRLPTSYRNRVKSFCKKYGLVSGKGYTGGIESDISTVLVFSAVDNWLKMGGRIGVLITWTVFKSNSARGFRLGRLPDGSGIALECIEDMTAVQPFSDANNSTGIYVGRKVPTTEQVNFDQTRCLTWHPLRGVRLDPNRKLAETLQQVEIIEDVACPVADFGAPLFTGSREDFDRVHFLRGTSPYLKRARRGTVNDLSRVYWVKVERYSPETGRALIRTLDETELSRADTVQTTRGTWVETNLLYPLIRGRDVGRYSSQTEGWYQLIPNDRYDRIEDEAIFATRFPASYGYFSGFRQRLLARSTYKRYMKQFPFYAIYCVGEYSFAPYKVVWPEQQTPSAFRAAVISSPVQAALPNQVFVPDHKLYFVSTSDPQEAHFLCAFLNSRPARTWLGGFLLDTQIGTSIFDFIKVPQFDPMDARHIRLADISQEAHQQRANNKTSSYLDDVTENELAELVLEISATSTPTETP